MDDFYFSLDPEDEAAEASLTSCSSAPVNDDGPARARVSASVSGRVGKPKGSQNAHVYVFPPLLGYL